MQKQPLVGPTNMVVRRNGWLYVYVSNESNQDVYFDDIIVNHKRGPVVEQTDYYPFGTGIAGLGTKAIGFAEGNNRYKFNGKETQSKEFSDGSGLEWYDYGARMYDPQVGRWFAEDPLSSKFEWESPYAYVLNIPTGAIDPDGRLFFGLFGSTSEQRKSARKIADISGGEVHNTLSRKNIHINYTETQISNDDTKQATVTNHNVYFSDEGVAVAKSARAYLNTKEGEKEWKKIINSAWGPGTSQWSRINYLTGEKKLLDGPLETPMIDPIDLAAGLFYAAGTLAEKATVAAAGRVFWSGGEAAEKAAAEFAVENGMQTIGMTRAGANLEQLTTNMEWSEAAPLWKRLSAAFARGTQGDAHVFLNAAGISSKSIWLTTEKPILEGMGIRIIEHVVNQ